MYIYKKKDGNGIFNLNPDCILEIMKYVITDCQLNPQNDYNDLINFVLADEFFVELLADYHKILS